MITELLRCFKKPLYWIVLGGGLSVRMLLACFDRMYRSAAFWALSADFWNQIGSATVGFLIVLVLIHLFSVDRERRTLPVICSTVWGRGRLFCNRCVAGGIAAVFGVLLMAAGNVAVTKVLGRGLLCPQDWTASFARASVVVMVGAVGFFIFTACVCDLCQNQPAAMCICGVPFAVSYFLNVIAIKPFEPFWFIRYGFFTELVRGRPIDALPVFWAAWYALLLAGILLLTIKKRRERKEL